eukprot:SAG22_NODE_2070_length_3052_cov_1.855401_3_plen_187_part_00
MLELEFSIDSVAEEPAEDGAAGGVVVEEAAGVADGSGGGGGGGGGEENAGLVRLQALVRGQSARKRAKKRGYVAMEVLQTETNYIGQLKALVQQYILPLRHGVGSANGQQILAQSELRAIFSEVESIRNLHETMLLPQLRKRVGGKAAVAAGVVTIGDLFSPSLMDVFKMYTVSSKAVTVFLPCFH